MGFLQPPFSAEIDSVNMRFPSPKDLVEVKNDGTFAADAAGVFLHAATGINQQESVADADQLGSDPFRLYAYATEIKARMLVSSLVHADSTALAALILGNPDGAAPLGTSGSEAYIAFVAVFDTVSSWQVVCDDGQGNIETFEPYTLEPNFPRPVVDTVYTMTLQFSGPDGAFSTQIDEGVGFGGPTAHMSAAFGRTQAPPSYVFQVLAQSGNHAAAELHAAFHSLRFRQVVP